MFFLKYCAYLNFPRKGLSFFKNALPPVLGAFIRCLNFLLRRNLRDSKATKYFLTINFGRLVYETVFCMVKLTVKRLLNKKMSHNFIAKRRSCAEEIGSCHSRIGSLIVFMVMKSISSELNSIFEALICTHEEKKETCYFFRVISPPSVKS